MIAAGFDARAASLGTFYTLNTRCATDTSARFESLAVGPLYPESELTWIEVDPRGVITKAYADRQPGEAAPLPFEAPIVIFPEEAVGEGAEWSVDQPTGEGNVANMKFSVLRIQGDLIELRRTRPGARPETSRTLVVSTQGMGPLTNTPASVGAPLERAKADLVALRHCAESCAKAGRCSPHGDQCEADTPSDCWYSDACREDGKCSLAVDHCDTASAAEEYRKAHPEDDQITPEQQQLMNQYLDKAADKEQEENAK